MKAYLTKVFQLPDWKGLGSYVLPFFLVLPCNAESLVDKAIYQRDTETYHQIGESLVLAGEEPSNLAYTPSRSMLVDVRNSYRNNLPTTVHYEPIIDYLIDEVGRIRRTPNSRIPDFRFNPLYRKVDFDSKKFPDHANEEFFVYVDYYHLNEKLTPIPPAMELGAINLPKTRKKLGAGKNIRIVAFGDSITAGAESSSPNLIFWQRWADSLRLRHPRATIEIINSATAGDLSEDGLKRVDQKVIAQKPDLVLIGFGMNDITAGVKKVPFRKRIQHLFNKALVKFGLAEVDKSWLNAPPEPFADRLRTIVDRIQLKTGAEVVLFSAFPPNPNWNHGKVDMAAFSAATELVARERHCAYADVYHNWLQFAGKKKPEDLLVNNINHPNDFGHWIYFKAFEAINL